MFESLIGLIFFFSLGVGGLGSVVLGFRVLGVVRRFGVGLRMRLVGEFL